MALRQFGRYRVETSREGKILFPADSISKGDVIDYYSKIAKIMLPHLKDRPLMLQRFPDGIVESGFYQKNVSDYFPKWMQRAELAKKNGTVVHPLCNNTASLVYLADQAAITFHSWLSRKDKPNIPDRMIFDLDPKGDDFEPARNAAIRLHDLLAELKLTSFAMTTGSRGLHVVVPLHRKEDFDSVRDMARKIAAQLMNKYPDAYTLEQSTDKRKGRLFIDTNRNAYAQTAVAPYSLRAKQGAPVATPLRWDELESESLDAGFYTISNIFRRLGAMEDPWKGMSRRGQTLTSARTILSRNVQ